MFVLWSFLISILFCVIDLIYIKTFQLEGYKLKKFLQKAENLDFAFGRKTPLVFTKRVLRLIFCDFLIKFCVFMLLFGLIPLFWVNFLLVILLVIFSFAFVTLTFLAMHPIEEQIKKMFIKKAKQRLKEVGCKTIAITGSFGKTSTKNILYQILKEEFDVSASPKSYNTPMGICKTILENLKDTDDFLIVEFGARQKGDIEELSRLVGVDFAIITPVGNCHLETFGSLQNIENTKYELCENTKNMVVFNGESEANRRMFARFERKKFLVAKEGSFAYAKEVETNSSGSHFVMVLDGKEFSCHTTLLGRANIDNIVVASAMAYLLGESIVSIRKAIKNLKSTPHRLELIKGDFVNVIDDSYNSNFQGFKEALKTLSTFPGKKIVVSPGIVELGDAQFDVNRQVGEEVAKVADVFVIMNETNKEALSKGAQEMNEIYFASSRKEQKELLKKILKKGDVVLFENDFPDNIK